MEINFYAVYDKKAESFSPPFTMQNGAMAERIFRAQVSDTSMVIGQNPGDFSLFHLGEIDLVTGKINQDKRKPVEIISGLACQAE